MRRITIEISGMKEREIATLLKRAAKDVMRIYNGTIVVSEDNGHEENPPKVPDYAFGPRNERMGVLRR